MSRFSSAFLAAGAICAAAGFALAQDSTSSAPAPIQLPGIQAQPQTPLETVTPAPLAPPAQPQAAPALGTAAPDSNPPAAPGTPAPATPGAGGQGAASQPPAQTETPQLRGTSADQAPLDLGVKPPPPPGSEGAPGAAAPGGDALLSPAEEHREIHDSWPVAVLRGLDKVTARVVQVDAPIGEPVMFGRLEMTARYCYKRPPEEPPEVTAFIDITDKHAKDPKLAKAFSGWMFASSPGLHGLEHPTYDVWLIDCKASTPESDFGSLPKEPAPKQLDAKQPDKRN